MKALLRNLLSADAINENEQQGVESSKPKNVARRFIALVVTFFWVFVGFAQVVLVVSGMPGAKELHDFAVVYVMPSFTVIAGFYFLQKVAGR